MTGLKINRFEEVIQFAAVQSQGQTDATPDALERYEIQARLNS